MTSSEMGWARIITVGGSAIWIILSIVDLAQGRLPDFFAGAGLGVVVAVVWLCIRRLHLALRRDPFAQDQRSPSRTWRPGTSATSPIPPFERIILPDSTILQDYVQRRMLGLVRGMVVNAERMREKPRS